MDCHTSEGSFHEEPVTFTWKVNPTDPRTLIHYTRDQMMPFVQNTLRNNYKVENVYYGLFIEPLKMEKGCLFDSNELRYPVKQWSPDFNPYPVFKLMPVSDLKSSADGDNRN